MPICSEERQYDSLVKAASRVDYLESAADLKGVPGARRSVLVQGRLKYLNGPPKHSRLERTTSTQTGTSRPSSDVPGRLTGEMRRLDTQARAGRAAISSMRDALRNETGANGTDGLLKVKHLNLGLSHYIIPVVAVEKQMRRLFSPRRGLKLHIKAYASML